MEWIKIGLITFLCFIMTQTSKAQYHYNAWFKVSVSLPLGRKIKLDNELQHRRQNNLDNSLLVDRNLMYTYRNWIHYQHNKVVKISLSPFAYFSNYRIIQKPLDEAAKPIQEIRFSAAVEIQHRLLNTLYMLNRTAIEYRTFDHNISDITRIRFRSGLKREWTSRLTSSAYYELFLNFSGVTSSHFYDHERIGLYIDYKILSDLKMELGYIHITRLPLLSTNKLKEMNIFLNLSYQLHHAKLHPIQ